MKHFAIWSAVVLTQAAYGQFGRSAEWMTAGGDAQRTNSIPADNKITPEQMRKPGFEFLWKAKVNNEPVQLNSLTPAVLIDRYIGYRGFRSLAFVGGSANMVYAVDTDLNRIEWQKRLSGPVPRQGTLTCPGGLTANIARGTSPAFPPNIAGGGGLGGRGGPARSDAGTANEGGVTIGPTLAAQAAAAAAPPRGNLLRMPVFVYALGGDGDLHSMYLSNGEEPKPPMKFLPANSSAYGLVVFDDVAYAATRNCNGAPSAVWSFNLSSGEVKTWKGDLAGSLGPAFGPDGTLFVTTTDGRLVALESKTLAQKGSYESGGGFASSAMVFPWKDRVLAAAAANDGSVHLVDAQAVVTGQAKALFKGSTYAAAAGISNLATWQASDGTRWLLAATNAAPSAASGFSTKNGAIASGAIVAWRMAEASGAPLLEPVWTSRDMKSPLTPMIINGVVFAVSSGEFRTSDPKMTAEQIARRSSPAVLYALDLQTGAAIWESGKTMTSFAHSGALSGGASQLYIQTYDQNIYAFGYPIEH